MRVTVNGSPRDLADGTRLPGLIPDGRGVAVAVNGCVVPAADWPTTVLRERDRVEIVTAKQGG